MVRKLKSGAGHVGDSGADVHGQRKLPHAVFAWSITMPTPHGVNSGVGHVDDGRVRVYKKPRALHGE